ncbi:simple sugar transport system permease protein [Streptosporangium becharense]|uniref:Simple sugar transport system permease protein n=1 Tax=Streptosporangium becharense TaxID=1816182 RepID=A0A7W9IF09_9ACTN|nr:ABC transporter permease [Streptosporangium becharense]MBB2909591.1 simple sugar transport system permease protein [Streptosporangium becharense]MBB5819453.1 simple sugar transport system permease protein [Streptosporangium becharense]
MTQDKSTFADRLLGRVSPTGLLSLVAPVLAIAFAALVTMAVLWLTGDPPVETLASMAEYGVQPRSIVLTLNEATTYYLSALAVAVGFRMNLFNIGVDGQYRLAALTAAAVGGAVTLPAPLHIALIVFVAVLVGAGWAAIAGLLKVKRGVSEVISTIMLNAIATSLGAWLLNKERLAVEVAGSNNIGTRPIAESGQVPGLALIPGTQSKVFGLIILAVVMGVLYHVLLNRTRFGFDLRATGRSETAAVASGVNVKRMVLIAMVLSGAVAGLIGMPQLLGASYSYSLDFPTGLGFTGIAIALLGRNHPIGIAFGALLWAFLNTSSGVLQLEGISPDIVAIMQGTIVLSVIIAYELVHRYQASAKQRRVSRELAGAPTPAEGVSV